MLRPKMPELDSVRGIAILMVVFYHGFASRYGTAGLSGIRKFLVALTGPGWTGVNLFFALSGFLITGILLDSKGEKAYYSRFSPAVLFIVDSFFIPFLLLGIIGLRLKRSLPLMTAALAYVVLHFLILPNWQERWVCVFYLSMVVSTLAVGGNEMALSPINIGGFLRSGGVLRRMKSRVARSITFVP